MGDTMRAVEILTSCEDERADYEGLKAASVLYGVSRGREPGAQFPSPAELGIAAELLDLIGVGGWDHLVESRSRPNDETPQVNLRLAEVSPNKSLMSKVAVTKAAGKNKKPCIGQENQPPEEDEMLAESSGLFD